MPHSLRPFIEAARSQGADDAFVSQMLMERGWPDEQVAAAFAELYQDKTGQQIPPPPGGKGENAKDAFYYLLSFATLAVWAGALASLIYTLINRQFPDPLNPGYYGSATISAELAAIIIAFPLYLFVTRLIAKDASAHPEKLESGVRKWLTYLTLFIAAGFVIGDLITFLRYLLEGELSTRFVLKVLVILVIAGGIFWRYLAAIRARKA